MKKTIFLFLCFAILCVLACNKQNATSGNGGLLGNWNFVSVTAQTQVSSQYSLLGTILKTVSASSYTSANGTGSLSFAGNMATSNNIAYTVSSNVLVQNYQNQNLVNTFNTPLSFVSQVPNNTNPFTIVGTDSIAFAGSGIISPQNMASGSVLSTPNGYRFSINADTLTLTSNFVKDTVFTSAGNSYSEIDNALYLIKFSRQ